MRLPNLLTVFFTFSFIFFFAAMVTWGAEIRTGDSDVNVNISNSTGGNSSLNVKNHVSASTNTTSTNTSETKVRVEQNGVVKEFNSAGGTDIDYTSEDGSVKVNVKNNGVDKVEVSEIPDPTSIPQKAKEVLGEETMEDDEFTQEVVGDKEELQKENIFWRLIMATPGPFNAPFQVTTLLVVLNSLF